MLFFFGAAMPTTQAADTQCIKDGIARNDGGCWNSLSLSEKAAVVRGIWVGQSSRINADDAGGSSSFRYPRDWLSTPDSTMAGDVIDYFDLLYKTPANRSVTWEWACILAAMNARDDDSDDRLSLLKFLREHGSIPFSGTLVGVKGPDVVTIHSDQGTFDVKLDGVSSEGLSASQKLAATAFLKGMQHGDSYFSASMCNPAKNLPVALAYKYQFFDGNMLAADLQIANLGVMCSNGVVIDPTELWKGIGWPAIPQALSLNYFLIEAGLLRPDEKTDPKWPDALIQARPAGSLTDKATAGHLYIYGNETVPVVEKIAAQGAANQ